MRILVVGGEGTVGKAASSDLMKRHDIISAGRNSGAFRVDVMNVDSIAALFKAVGALDAVIVTTGHTHFGPVAEMTPMLFRKGVDDKLMGQVSIALLAQHHLNVGG